MTGIVEIDFGFTTSSMSVGSVLKNDSKTRAAFLEIKDTAKTKITGISTSSEFVTAEIDDGKYENGKVKINITINPGLPLGRINQTVTVTSSNPDKPDTKLRLSGTVIGEIEIKPENLTYIFSDSSGILNGDVKKITIINRSDSLPLEIIDISDPDGYLSIEREIIAADQQFQLICTLSEDNLPTKIRHNGRILLKTSNPEESEKTIGYRIIKRQ